MSIPAPQAMTLGELLRGIDGAVVRGDAILPIRHVHDDSRQIGEGGLFVARQGHDADGRAFIGDALERGAVAVFTDAAAEVPPGVTRVSVDDPGAWLSELAERSWGRPSRRLKLIGVTGTNGKTTTAFMVRHLLNATGGRCGMITTIEADAGNSDAQPTDLTTPGACEVTELLAAMVANGCDHAVMEVSSHALDQGRVAALDFAAAVFTNLSGDHLDYHRTMEAYAAAKAKLFDLLGADGVGLFNCDDAHARRMMSHCAGRAVEFSGQGNVDAQYVGKAACMTAEFTGIDMLLPAGRLCVRSPLVGLYNVANLMGALAAVMGLGVDVRDAIDAVGTMRPVPGRLERVTAAEAPFTVLVDYAHTDDALRNVLGALRPLTPDGSALRVLFGCGGDRDDSKRPRMAAAACELADQVVITSDNPRQEPPEAIITQIETGVPTGHRDRVSTITDRREAIDRIIATARAGDIVLLAGKGHEDYQIVGTDKQPFDDRRVAAEVLESRGIASMNRRKADEQTRDLTPG